MGELNTAEWASFLRSQSASSPHPAALAPVGSLRQQEVGRGQKWESPWVRNVLGGGGTQLEGGKEQRGERGALGFRGKQTK